MRWELQKGIVGSKRWNSVSCFRKNKTARTCLSHKVQRFRRKLLVARCLCIAVNRAGYERAGGGGGGVKRV